MADQGYFVWYDLMTNDIDSAKAFYGEVVGWGVEQFKGSDPSMPYQMLVGPRGPIGGLMQLPQQAQDMGAPPSWLTYISVEDLDASVQRAVALGATVLNPAVDIPEVGAFAVLADPTGAVFSPFQAHGDMPPRTDSLNREVSWHELWSDDPAAAYAFYQQLFGWQDAGSMDMGGHGTYRMFRTPGGGGGVAKRMPEAPASFWLFYFQVESLDLALSKVQEHGGKVVAGPMSLPDGDVFATAVDPQGAVFGLHSKAPPKA